ncbi:MAG: PfkB family carbohydrate kinase [Actinomycetaceae bacterium]|nr:PfkB family carbohydrate kinase [Actinomycetaceae bacterium]
MGRFLSTQPVVLNLPTVIPTLPTRGGTVLARSVLASPGGGFIGLATATQMGVETAMLSVLGTGPNSFMVRRELLKHGVKILTDEVVGDIGVAIQMVESDGNTTVIVSTGIESEPPVEKLSEIEIKDGDVVLAHGACLAMESTAGDFVEWVAGIQPNATVVVSPSPMLDQLDARLWPPLLERADIVTMNLRESSLLPRLLATQRPGANVRDYVREECIVVRRMGAMGCEWRQGSGERHVVPAFPSETVDTTGVGDTHIATMCASLALGYDIETAILTANAAGAVMISHAYTFPVPSMREISSVMGQAM